MPFLEVLLTMSEARFFTETNQEPNYSIFLFVVLKQAYDYKNQLSFTSKLAPTHFAPQLFACICIAIFYLAFPCNVTLQLLALTFLVFVICRVVALNSSHANSCLIFFPATAAHIHSCVLFHIIILILQS